MDLHIQYTCETFECKKTNYEERGIPPIKDVINHDQNPFKLNSKNNINKKSKKVRNKKIDDFIKTRNENYDYSNKKYINYYQRIIDDLDDDIINNILELSKHDK
jgi:hypothetical protein